MWPWGHLLGTPDLEHLDVNISFFIYRYLRNGECVEDCGDGAYKHTDPEDKHKSCQHCHWLCNTCAGPGPDQCIECSNDATREGERCSPICNDKWVWNNGSWYWYESLTVYILQQKVLLWSIICPFHSWSTLIFFSEYLKPWGQLDHQTDSSYNISEAPCANCSTECATCSGPRESDCKSCANAQALSPGKDVVQRFIPQSQIKNKNMWNYKRYLISVHILGNDDWISKDQQNVVVL